MRCPDLEKSADYPIANKTCVAAMRFAGFWSDRSLKRRLAQLQDFIRDNRLKTDGEPVYAFYDPPWTLPFLRRNEILYNLAEGL